MASPLVKVVRGPSVDVCVLQVRRATAAHEAALSRSFGTLWPSAPNTAAQIGATTIAWLGPGEWAVMGMPAQEVRRRAFEALDQTLHLIADITDGRAAFTVDGAASRALLAKGCSLDFHKRVFPPGTCAQTLLAQCDVLVHRPADTDRFELLVDATLAAHLEAWFADAGLELL